jgi:6-pyruvoyltetrahydropterin/6-carboxytetrahydropterin synthase
MTPAPRPSSPAPSFRIRIADEGLVFSAGHFITLGDGHCERLHGHTYRASAEISGPLDDNRCVVDFAAARAAIGNILAELDHRMLLPEGHSAIRVLQRGHEVEAAFGDRRWVFPADDCLVLPVANTTTELLAEYIGRRLLAALGAVLGKPGKVRIEIGEGTGASAACEIAVE